MAHMTANIPQNHSAYGTWLVYIKNEFVRDAQTFQSKQMPDDIWDESRDDDWRDTAGDMLVLVRSNCTLEDVETAVRTAYPEAAPDIFRIDLAQSLRTIKE